MVYHLVYVTPVPLVSYDVMASRLAAKGSKKTSVCGEFGEVFDWEFMVYIHLLGPAAPQTVRVFSLMLPHCFDCLPAFAGVLGRESYVF